MIIMYGDEDKTVKMHTHKNGAWAIQKRAADRSELLNLKENWKKGRFK